MQSTRSEQNRLLIYLSTVSTEDKNTERLKNCNGETASGFALLACRFTIRGMSMDYPLRPAACLNSPANISLLFLEVWITSLELVILVASNAVKTIS